MGYTPNCGVCGYYAGKAARFKRLLIEVLSARVHSINLRGVVDEPHVHLPDGLVERIALSLERWEP